MTDQPIRAADITHDEMLLWLNDRAGQRVHVSVHVLPGVPVDNAFDEPFGDLDRLLAQELGENQTHVTGFDGTLRHWQEVADEIAAGTRFAVPEVRGHYYVGDSPLDLSHLTGRVRGLGVDAVVIWLDERVRLVVVAFEQEDEP